jgi:hypothetical protein
MTVSKPGLRMAMRLCLPSCTEEFAMGVSWKTALSGVQIAKVENTGDIGVNAAWAGEVSGEARLFLRQFEPLLRDQGGKALLDLGVVAIAESIACLWSICSGVKLVTS